MVLGGCDCICIGSATAGETENVSRLKRPVTFPVSINPSFPFDWSRVVISRSSKRVCALQAV